MRPGFQWVTDSSLFGGHVTMLGHRQETMNTFYEVLGKLAANVSITKTYKCASMMLRNKTDFLMKPNVWPSANERIVKSSAVVDGSRIVFGSFYDPATGSEEKTDLLDAFRAFSASVWILILVATACLTSLHVGFVFASYYSSLLPHTSRVATQSLQTSSATRQRKNKKPGLSESLGPAFAGYICEEEENANQSMKSSFVTAIYILFSFFVTFYFSSMINTEAVVHKPPKTIQSYADIARDKEVIPMFMNRVPRMHLDFIIAAPGSDEHTIWKRNPFCATVQSCSGFIKFLPTKPQSQARLLDGKEVWFDLEFGARVRMLFACTHDQRVGKGRLPLIRGQSNAETMLGMLVSPHLPSDTRKAMDRRYRRLIEMGSYLAHATTSEKMNVHYPNSRSVQLCNSYHTVIQADSVFQALDTRQHAGILIVMAVLFILAFYAFIGEGMAVLVFRK